MKAIEPRATHEPLVPDDDEPRPACPVCGTARGGEEPILCRACGEPVLRGGWAP